MSQETFPIQSERGAKPHPLRIPWYVAELAYSVYSARYGRSQSLDELASRGGFGPGEMDMFLPDWRERCDHTAKLEAVCVEVIESLELIENAFAGTDGCDVATVAAQQIGRIRHVLRDIASPAPTTREAVTR